MGVDDMPELSYAALIRSEFDCCWLHPTATRHVHAAAIRVTLVTAIIERLRAMTDTMIRLIEPVRWMDFKTKKGGSPRQASRGPPHLNPADKRPKRRLAPLEVVGGNVAAARRNQSAKHHYPDV